MAEEKNPIDLVEESFQGILDAFGDFETLRDSLYKAQSDSDLALAEMYHKIEGFNPTHVSQSHYMFLELQSILRKRRNVKGAASMIRAINDSMNLDAVKKTKVKAKNRHNEIMNQLKAVNKKAEKIIKKPKK